MKNMNGPKEEAIALLKEFKIQDSVINEISKYLDNAPLDTQGQLDLPALKAKYKGDKLVVTSRRVKNLTINFWDALITIGAGVGTGETLGEHHPTIARILETLNAINALSGALNVELGDKSAEIVKELWISRRDAKSVPEE